MVDKFKDLLLAKSFDVFTQELCSRGRILKHNCQLELGVDNLLPHMPHAIRIFKQNQYPKNPISKWIGMASYIKQVVDEKEINVASTLALTKSFLYCIVSTLF